MQITNANPLMNEGIFGLDGLDGVSSASTGSGDSAGLGVSPSGMSEPYLDFSGVPSLDQNGNACGTTSLAMILMYLTGKPYSQAQIDQVIRRVNSFGTSPLNLKDYAESQGLECGMYNHSSINDIKGQLAEGHPVMVSLSDPYNDSSGAIDKDFKDHYVTVTGFKVVDGQEYVEIRDPNTASAASGVAWDNPDVDKQANSSGDYLMPVSTFESKWGQQTDDGYSNFMLAFAPGGSDLPPDNLDGCAHSVAIGQTYWNELNNFNRITSPDSVGSFMHGVIGDMGGAVPLLWTGVGWCISAFGQHLNQWAQNWPPVLKQLGMATGDLLDIPGCIISQIGLGFSQAADQAGQAVEDLCNGNIGDAAADAGNAVVDVGKGVVDAVGGAVSDVGDAIGDLF